MLLLLLLLYETTIMTISKDFNFNVQVQAGVVKKFA